MTAALQERERERLIDRGLRRAAHFSWEATASRTDAAIELLLHQGPSDHRRARDRLAA